uniref:Uncharacterized protein n=1 Tax=Ascaris lumbricoides TaxID=6252 RepID=A0A0M3HZ56_ASCLU
MIVARRWAAMRLLGEHPISGSDFPHATSFFADEDECHSCECVEPAPVLVMHGPPPQQIPSAEPQLHPGKKKKRMAFLLPQLKPLY